MQGHAARTWEQGKKKCVVIGNLPCLLLDVKTKWGINQAETKGKHVYIQVCGPNYK